jgi:hypothetical protein
MSGSAVPTISGREEQNRDPSEQQRKYVIADE